MIPVDEQLLVREHLAKVRSPQPLSEAKVYQYQQEIKKHLQAEDAVLVAHYYTPASIQALAEATGGFIGDSLEMARFGAKHPAQTLLVAGVRFMGETAKILSPQKRVLMPTLEATCSLDLGCLADDFGAFCDQHPERTVLVYANTSAAVKARADWVVTSSIALQVVEYLHGQGKKLLWAPDKHLGDYIRRTTGAEMLLWEGSCIVHEEFKAKGIVDLKKVHPGAAVLAHPEAPASVLEVADEIGSTSQLLKAAKQRPNQVFIVATDRGIFYKMQQENPGKLFLEAPTAGEGASCRSCAHCPWMAMNTLDALAQVLQGLKTPGSASQEIQVPPNLIAKALVPLQRMLDFPR